MLGSTQVVYNIPSVNQTLLDGELAQGNFSLLPAGVSVCSTQVDGQSFAKVSGFSESWWGGTATNSTEFVFGGWESFLTVGAGWPAEPPCG
ncbi:MAG: hypothetical protein JRN46_01390 [Nitrososphaerota archaeon]|nr:hypothetical protein [Nitrososphaerota archaeon]